MTSTGRKAIGVSIGLHVLLFVIFAVRAVIYPASDALNLEDSIRVDIVALPDKKSAELPPLPAPAAPEPPKKAPVEESKPQPKPEPVKPAAPAPESPKVNLEKTKKDQAAALKRLEALERIERMQKAESKAKAAEAKPSKPAVTGEVTGQTSPGHVVRGNQVSQGNSLTGLQRDAHRGYLANVQAQVKRAWRLPQWMANANYSARVRIWVDSNGNVIKKQMIRSSGSPDFDERVMNSIEQAGALPAPPADLVNILSVDGLDADFP